MISCFFFKQKTPYDMRSSDWSSYVCSSDLRHRGLSPRHHITGGIEHRHRAAAGGIARYRGFHRHRPAAAEQQPQHDQHDGDDQRPAPATTRLARPCTAIDPQLIEHLLGTIPETLSLKLLPTRTEESPVGK